MTELSRTLGFWGAAAIGIGAIIGAGIFVLIGVASGLAGPGVIISFLIAGIVLFTGTNLDWLASLFNFGTLLTFVFINLSLIRLRRTMPDAKRTFHVPLYPFVPVAAIIGCIILAFYLNLNAIIIACFFIAIGLLVYVMNRRVNRV